MTNNKCKQTVENQYLMKMKKEKIGYLCTLYLTDRDRNLLILNTTIPTILTIYKKLSLTYLPNIILLLI